MVMRHFCRASHLAGRKTRTHSYRYRKIFNFSLFVILFGLLSFVGLTNPAHATEGQNGPSLTLSVKGNMTLEAKRGEFSASSPVEISVTTDNYTGYTLTFAGSPNNKFTGTTNNNTTATRLINKDYPESFISSITSPSSPENFASNTWGFLPNKINSNDNTLYQPIPNLSGVVLDATNTPNNTANTYSIVYGVKLDSTIKEGDYVQSLTFAVTANPAQYTINYNKNTADTVTNLPQNQGGNTSGNTVTISNKVPKRNGYTFTGWCNILPTTTNGIDSCTGNNATIYNPNGNGTNLTYTIDTSMVNSLDLYAMWTRVFAINYNSNGGTGTMNPQTITGTNPVQLVGNAFSREWYTFAGWNTATDGTGTPYDDQAEFAIPATGESITLYAQWNRTFTVNFNANGGEGTMTPQVLNNINSANLKESAFTRSGYTFAGWNTIANGSGLPYEDQANFTVPATGNSITLYAQWTRTFTINYNSNNGTGTMDSQTIYGTAPIQLSNNVFTRSGYIFAGWNTAANGTGTPYDNQAEFTIPSTGESITLYAQWTRTFTINYSANGGTGTMNPQTITGATSANLNENTFTRSGYIFAGWNTIANGTGIPYSNQANFTIPTAGENITLYAQWTRTFTINYNANGGTGTMPSQTITGATSANLNENTFTRSGYNFAGWNTAANGSGTSYGDKVNFTVPATGESVTLYAIWTRTFTINFNANGGEGTMNSQVIDNAASAQLTNNAFTREGYNFSGWNTESNGTGTSYVNQATFAVPDTGESITLYAMWTRTFTINFNANGGTGTMNSQTITGATSANLTNNAFTREGYFFAGWNTMANGSGLSYGNQADFTIPTTGGSITLYAQWTRTFTINYNANGGTGTMNPQTITGAASANLNDNAFTRSGYIFAGWNVMSNGSGLPYSNQAEFTVPATGESITLYAQWTRQFVINYNANGGTGTMDSQTITGATSANLNENTFTREDYNFTGWNTEANGSGDSYDNQAEFTVPATGESITLYAQWAHIFTINFNANGGEGTMDPQTIIGTDPTPLNINTFTKEGQSFMGWNTETDDSGDFYGDQAEFTAPATGDSITLYAQWGKGISNLTYMQDFALLSTKEIEQVKSSMTVNTAYQLKDNRDEKTYSLSKINNVIWMTTNLNIAGGTELTPEKSNVSSNYALPPSTTTGFNNNNTPYVYNDNTYGGYYSFTAVTAGTNPSSGNATSDICPKGWKLPTKDNYDTLRSIYTTANSIIAAPWYGTYGGLYLGSTHYNAGTGGHYWSSTAQNGGLSYYLNLKNDSGNTQVVTGDKYYGFSARCIAKPTNTVITFDANGGEGTMAPQSLGEATSGTLKSNTFTRGGYAFAGWNTAADGSGDSFANGATYTGPSTTLYAQWREPNDITELTYMQDFATLSATNLNLVKNSMTANQAYQLKDRRDNKTYKITKLSADGKIWMTSNLNLDGGTILTPTTSNVSSDYTLPNFGTGQLQAFVYSNGTYYYTYAAATAGTNPSSGNATSDICPKGWRLPTEKEFNTLKTTYTTGAKLTAAPWYGSYSGGFSSENGLEGSIGDEGTFGFYWSSTAYGSDSAALITYWSSGSNVPARGKGGAYTLRCLAK